MELKDINLDEVKMSIFNKISNNCLEELKVDIKDSFQNNFKYEVSHHMDPPYDHSGSLVNTGSNFLLSDYETVDEFLEEYSGNSMPSYCSGCGMFHQTFKDDINEYLDIFVSDEAIIYLIETFGFPIKEDENWFDDNDDLFFELTSGVEEEMQNFLEIFYQTKLADLIDNQSEDEIQKILYTRYEKMQFSEELEEETQLKLLDFQRESIVVDNHLIVKFLDLIAKNDYNKIITIVDYSGQIKGVFDIQKNGFIGYAASHKKLLILALEFVLKYNGIVMVREFLPFVHHNHNFENRNIKIPYKNVYGYLISDSSFHSINKEKLKLSYAVDSETGASIEPEEELLYLTAEEI